MPRCGILRSRKLPERVNRNEQCERSKRSRAKIEAADRKCFLAAGGLDLPATSIGALLAWSASHCLFRLTHSPRFRLWRMTHWVTTRIIPRAAYGSGRDDNGGSEVR